QPAAHLKLHDWHRSGLRFRCLVCEGIFSASSGTASTGLRTDLSTFQCGVRALAEGVSIRATGRLIETDKDTVQRWLPLLGHHCSQLMNYFLRNLHLSECQSATREPWTFILKKEAHLTTVERLQEICGDGWVGIAFSPVCKLVPARVISKRTLPQARRLVFRLKSAMDGQIPFSLAPPARAGVTSDELPH
ncbi:MAG: hypothetical protein ABI847_03930, partial [Anaerolineales bacterium]